LAAFEGRGSLLRRRPWLLGGAALMFGVHVYAVAIGAPSWARVVYQALAITLVWAFTRDGYRARRTGVLQADADGLRLDGAMVAPRATIASAFVLASGEPVVRVVLRRRLSIDAVLEDEERARPLVDALGFGIGQSIATFRARYGGRLRTVLFAITAALAGGAASIVLQRWGTSTALVVVAAVVLGVFLPLQLRLTANVDVGSDGVLVRRLGEQRFLPYSTLERAAAEHAGDIVLALRQGESIRLSMGSATSMRDALVERIEEARAAFATSHGGGVAETLVAPGGRTVARWLEDLRALASARGYRQARVEPEQLWRVVDDPRAPATARAGAAVALAGTRDADARARLRVASEACADPRLRVALSRIAEAEADADVEDVLASLVDRS
jgi:hypothetical protein